MQALKISPSSSTSALCRPPNISRRGNGRVAPLASVTRGAETASPNAPLAGHEWSSGLANWVRNHSTENASEVLTRLEFPTQGLTTWMFRDLAHELPPFGNHALRAEPAQVLAALLAPMAGLHPEHREAQIKEAIATCGGRIDLPWLNRATVTRLLRALFGNDMRAHPPGEHPRPADLPGLRFWAAVRGNSELWVSDARWGATGAFLIEYPHSAPGLNPMDCPTNKMKLSWDGNLEKFHDLNDMPVVLTWCDPELASSPAPWSINPRHSARSMLDLFTSVSFEPVHLLPTTATDLTHERPAGNVHVSVVDPAARRVMAALHEKSDLLRHAEAWIAGLRYEAQHWRTNGRGEDIDAAELLSALSASVNQCPIELRLVNMLCKAHATRVNWSGLGNLPDGEWLNGVMEDLVGAKLVSAHLTFPTAKVQTPENLLRQPDAWHGTLQAWLTPHRHQGMPKPVSGGGILNIHLSGPLFGDTPATLCRHYARGEDFITKDTRVVLGETHPPMPDPDSKQLVFHFLGTDMPTDSHGLSVRAASHREFWNALLDFNLTNTVGRV